MFSQLDCEKSTFFFVFIAFVHSWLRSPKSKPIKKIKSTSDRFFMAVYGPSFCEKTELIFQILLRNTFCPNISSIYYFYQLEQPKFSTIERKVNIFFTKFSEFDFIPQLDKCLLVFDDSCEEIFNDKEFYELATAGRHRNISVILVKHNLFQ